MRFKKSIFIIILLLICFIVALTFVDKNKRYNVKINYLENTGSQTVPLKIYKSDGHESGDIESLKDSKPEVSINKPSVVRLKKGSYNAVITASDYKQQIISFHVDGDSELNIPIEYTEEKLNSLLKSEQSKIQSIISSNIRVPANYIIGNGALLNSGQWYITTITEPQPEDVDQFVYSDVYRIILEKKNNDWLLHTKTPQLILSSKTLPDVPKNVLDAANNL